MGSFRTNRVSVMSVMFVGLFGFGAGVPEGQPAEMVSPEGPGPTVDPWDPPSLLMTGYITRYLHHRVLPGQTLWGIGRAYGVHPLDLVVINSLENPDMLKPGTILKIPRSEDLVVDETRVSQWAAASARIDGQGSSSLEPSVRSGGSDASPRLSWPLLKKGRITSSFGPRWGGFHTGIDIAAPQGSPAVAAASGTVIRAERAGAYGLTVILDHGDGSRTLYAHLSVITVRKGQVVGVGQKLGKVGSTGRSTGPHLHLELRMSGSPVDPMPYLRPWGS